MYLVIFEPRLTYGQWQGEQRSVLISKLPLIGEGERATQFGKQRAYSNLLLMEIDIRTWLTGGEI